MKAVIIDYSPKTGKGKYRTEYGEEKTFRYTNLLHEKMLPVGSRVEIKKGIIIPAKGFWQKLRETLNKEIF